MALVREFNFVRDDVLEDASYLFETSDTIVAFPKAVKTTEELMLLAEAFPSRAQARKNGYRGLIPAGWSAKETGRIRYWIWNPSHSKEEWIKYEAACERSA